MKVFCSVKAPRGEGSSLAGGKDLCSSLLQERPGQWRKSSGEPLCQQIICRVITCTFSSFSCFFHIGVKMFEICYFSSAARIHESDYRRLNFPQVQRNCIMLVVTFNALGQRGCSEALKAVCETEQWCRGGNPWNWREMQCHCGCLCHGHAGSLKKGSTSSHWKWQKFSWGVLSQGSETEPCSGPGARAGPKSTGWLWAHSGLKFPCK